MTMKNWMDESTVGQSTDISRISMNSMKGQKVLINTSRKAKLEAELKLLEWHKLANDAALKAALLQTKNIKQDQPEVDSRPHTHDDAKWIRRVIDEEQVKPLEVTRNYVIEYEKKEKENSLRLSSQVERHISTLKKLRERLEQRHEVKSRADEYKAWQKGFNPKKQAVIMGRTLTEAETSQMSSLQADRGQKESKNELSAVLDSLNKLAELENRISSLENDNTYDYMLTKEKPGGGGVGGKSELDFKRKRVNINSTGSKGPLGVKYSVVVKQRAPQWQQDGRGAQVGGISRGSGVTAARTARAGNNRMSMGGGGVSGPRGRAPVGGQYTGGKGGGGGDGVFLTGMDQGDGDDEMDIYEAREQAKRERKRQITFAPPGQKSLRERVTSRRVRAKENSMGALKHEEALKEMAKRKTNQSLQTVSNRNNVNNRATNSSVALKGASSGLKTRNKYLQDFEKLKAGYGSKRGGQRFVSQTAPVMSSSHTGLDGSMSPSHRRVPSTQLGGTVTRRTTQPMKRKTQAESGNNGNRDGGMSSSNGNYNGNSNGNSDYNGYNGSQAISNSRINNNNSMNNSMNNNNNNNNNSNRYGSSNGIAVGGVAGLRALRGQRTGQQ